MDENSELYELVDDVEFLMRIGPCSRLHETLGSGRPVARQLRVALSPSATATSVLVSPPYTMSGGTGRFKQQKFSRHRSRYILV